MAIEPAIVQFRRALLDGKYRVLISGDPTPYTDLLAREFAESQHWDGSGEPDLEIRVSAGSLPGEFSDTVALGGGAYYSADPQCLVFTTRNKGQQKFANRDVRMILFGDILNGSKFRLYVQPTSGHGRYLRRLIRALHKGTTNTQLISDVSVLMSRLVEPLIYLSLPSKSATFLHAASVERNGKGILIFGFRDVGKTTTATMLTRSGYSLLSDDLCTLNADGIVGSFLKPLKVEGPLLLEDAESRKNLNAISTSERFLWRAARWGLQRNPKYLFLRLLPSELTPQIRTATSAELSHTFFVESRTTRQRLVTEMDRTDAVDMAVAHLEIEFEALLRHQEYAHSLALVLGRNPREVVNDLYERLRRIIESGFEKASSYLITVIPGDRHDTIARAIRETIEQSA